MDPKEKFTRWLRKFLGIPISVCITVNKNKIATVNEVLNFYEKEIDLVEYLRVKLGNYNKIPSHVKNLLLSRCPNINTNINSDKDLIECYLQNLEETLKENMILRSKDRVIEKDIILAGKLLNGFSVLIHVPEHYFLIL